MATRDTYKQIVTEDGIRQKLYLIPAADALSGTTLTIPDDVVLSVTGGKSKFNKRPVNLPTLDERTLTFNLAVLDENTTLRDIIFNAKDGNYYNIWVISDDDGNGALAEDDFIVRFIGVQKEVPDAEGEVSVDYNNPVEIQLIPAARFIIEIMSPPALVADILIGHSEFVDYDVTIVSETVDFMIDIAYVESSSSRYVLRFHSGSDTDIYGNGIIDGDNAYTEQRCTMYRLTDLFEIWRLLWLLRWRQLTHTDVDTGAEFFWASLNAPLNNLQFYKQDNSDTSDTPGDALDMDEIYFVGIIEERRVHAISNVALTSWTQIGGALYAGTSEKSAGWVAAYNGWNMLQDIASTFGAKILFEYTGGLDINLHWMPYFRSRTSAVTITTSDFTSVIKWKAGQYRLRACSAQLKGEQGITRVEHVVTDASENREGGNINALFNTNPVTTLEAIPFYHGAIVNRPPPHEPPGTTITYNVGRFRPNCLYYKDDSPPYWTDGSLFVRCHHHVDYDDGVTNNNTPDAFTLPDYGTGHYSLALDLRAYSVKVTRNAGLPYRMAKYTAIALGFQTMTLSGSASRDVFPLEKIGDSYSFDPSQISSYYSFVNSACWLIDCSEGTDGTNTVELIALGEA